MRGRACQKAGASYSAAAAMRSPILRVTRMRSQKQHHALATFPRWSLLAGEVEETEKEVVVRVEVPGMEKEDCRITVEGNMLYLSGEKRFEHETHDSTYHLTERAYGAFQRSISLPRDVDTDKGGSELQERGADCSSAQDRRQTGQIDCGVLSGAALAIVWRLWEACS